MENSSKSRRDRKKLKTDLSFTQKIDVETVNAISVAKPLFPSVMTV